jgi:hypothetical protein
MKKSHIYLACIILLVAAVVAIVFNYSRKEKEKENRTFSLLPRKGQANTAEWKLVKKQTDSLLTIIKEDPANTKSNLKLASLYIQEARVSGNYKYYDVAAMKHVNTVLKDDAKNFTALVLNH